MRGSWHVLYQDGSETYASNAQDPAFDADAGEVPFRAIRWNSVEQLVLESQAAKTSLYVNDLPDGLKVSLRERVIANAVNGETAGCFIVLTSVEGEPIEDSTLSALYWFPDGTTHDCSMFDCPDARKYLGKFLAFDDRALAPNHNIVQIAATADLTA